MRDQADRLRNIIQKLKAQQEAGINADKSKPVKHAKIITITSGKGGVGKTNVTVNLAIALSEMGYRVVILDADFGFANIDILFGIIPKYTLLDTVQNRKSIFEILCDGPCGIKFISGGSGVEELVKLEKNRIDKVIYGMSILDHIADIILVDTGAGLSDSVLSFVLAADEVIVVTTPEPTSITDAYSLIKMVSHRDKNKTLKVLVNKSDSIREAEDILNKLFLVANKFLSLNLEKLGCITNDDSVPKAVKMQQPFTLSFPRSNATRQIKEVSCKLLGEQGTDMPENGGIRGFMSRLVRLMNN